MEVTRRPTTAATEATTWARIYFAVQALAGAAWWVGVFTLPWVRTATLGTLDHRILAAVDIPLFVIASALVACGVRWAAWVAAPWTVLVAIGMALYATVTATAGWGALLMVAAAAGSTAAAIVVLAGRVPSEWLLIGPFSGPYRFVRNPMAIGGIAQGMAIGLMAGSWLVVVYALSGSLLWNTLVRPLEEADLEERFGSAFRAYRARVACWIPRRPLRSPVYDM